MCLRRPLVIVALVVGVTLPLLTRFVAEDSLISAMLVELPPRSWWLLACLARSRRPHGPSAARCATCCVEGSDHAAIVTAIGLHRGR